MYAAVLIPIGYPVKDDLHFCDHFAKRDETLLAALERLSEMDAKAKNYR